MGLTGQFGSWSEQGSLIEKPSLAERVMSGERTLVVEDEDERDRSRDEARSGSRITSCACLGSLIKLLLHSTFVLWHRSGSFERRDRKRCLRTRREAVGHAQARRCDLRSTFRRGAACEFPAGVKAIRLVMGRSTHFGAAMGLVRAWVCRMRCETSSRVSALGI